jgi:hypothetical protein
MLDAFRYRQVSSTFAARVRLVVGLACVVFAAASFAIYVPRTVRTLDGFARSNGYIVSEDDRLLTSGDIQGLPRQLQIEALDLIPPRANYAVLMPATPAAAAPYGINAITMESGPAFLRYLLLPRWQVGDPAQAGYVICFGCDTAPWDHHTTWLWTDTRGDAIGRVRRAVG